MSTILNKITSLRQGMKDWFFASCALDAKAPSWVDHRATFLFVLSVISYCSYLIIMQPNWVLDGGMWAETATNYYPNSTASSTWKRLFLTDAGYIPLPPRLIAFFGASMHLPAAVIPYFYTWSAILATGVMIGVFCLRPFRRVLESDSLRFLVVLSIFIVSDFETRSLINFSYFSVFFIAIVTALAWVDKEKDVPRWAWFCPLFVLSKPAVLAAVPAMVVVALVSKKRFRAIAVTSFVLSIVQVVQLAVSKSAGIMPYQAVDSSVLEKALAAIKYFLGFISLYSFGPVFYLYKPAIIYVDMLLFVGIIYLLLKNRRPAGALVVVGLSLILFEAVINSFALSSWWGINLSQLSGIAISRMTIGIFAGVIMVVAGCITLLTGPDGLVGKRGNVLTSVIFAIWFVVSGWFVYGCSISRQPPTPTINNSQWRALAYAIDSGVGPLCVPIDPLGWFYARDCRQLNPELRWGKNISFDSLVSTGAPESLAIPVPESILGSNLYSIALFVRPYYSTVSTSLRAKAFIKMKGGETRVLVGSRDVDIAGGLLMLGGMTSIPLKDVESLSVAFDVPVALGVVADGPVDTPAVLWMGN